jgi:hypothetical protein
MGLSRRHQVDAQARSQGTSLALLGKKPRPHAAAAKQRSGLSCLEPVSGCFVVISI